jgi:hypothetical protein
VLLFNAARMALQHLGLEQAHELANELHLAALAFKVGDAFGLSHGVLELVGQARRASRSARSVSRSSPSFCSSALSRLRSVRLSRRAFEFAFELQIAFAALGNELTPDEIAFF